MKKSRVGEGSHFYGDALFKLYKGQILSLPNGRGGETNGGSQDFGVLAIIRDHDEPENVFPSLVVKYRQH
jgi:hypothetical protein